jgi:dienelactone hydrolase
MEAYRWRRQTLLFVFLLVAGLAAFLAAGRALPGVHPPDRNYGAFGPEGPRLREQLWIVPGADVQIPLRATVFRPPEPTDGPVRRPLVVINHGSDSSRESVAMPVFYWLSKWFVERGYVVLLPQRRGHGATGGELAEGRDDCANPDHYASGLAGAADIEGALQFMSSQRFVDPTRTIVVGVSTGGWASLALASRNAPGVSLIVNFAGGRGGHAYGRPNAVCAPERLIDATAAYARTARTRTVWFYAANDSYFGPELATEMAQAWEQAGGLVDLELLPAYRSEGHEIASDRAGWSVWGSLLERAVRKSDAPARTVGFRAVH